MKERDEKRDKARNVENQKTRRSRRKLPNALEMHNIYGAHRKDQAHQDEEKKRMNEGGTGRTGKGQGKRKPLPEAK